MDWTQAFNFIKTISWLFLLLLGSASFFLMSPTFTAGLLFGGLMIIANFNILQYTIRKGFSLNKTSHQKKASIIAKYYVRLLVMGALLYFLLTRGWVHPVGLAIGLSIIVLSIVCLGIRMVLKTSSWETI